ncbi:MAG: hypothetical protein ACRDZ3_16920 [Acidimicrobiia bacterium]
MRRRSIVLLAGGLLALAIAPPVFGAGDSTTPPPGPGASPTTATTAPPDDDTMPPDDGDTGTPPDDDTGAPPDDGDTGAPPDDDTDMTTSTTAPDQDADATAPSDNCATPETLQEPAPAEGETVIYPAGESGEVEVSRVSPTELEIVSATAADGWTAEVTAPTGPRVKVRFVDSANTSNKTRFAASMDQKGEEIHVRVTNCS